MVWRAPKHGVWGVSPEVTCQTVPTGNPGGGQARRASDLQ